MGRWWCFYYSLNLVLSCYCTVVVQGQSSGSVIPPIIYAYQDFNVDLNESSLATNYWKSAICDPPDAAKKHWITSNKYR